MVNMVSAANYMRRSSRRISDTSLTGVAPSAASARFTSPLQSPRIASFKASIVNALRKSEADQDNTPRSFKRAEAAKQAMSALEPSEDKLVFGAREAPMPPTPVELDKPPSLLAPPPPPPPPPPPRPPPPKPPQVEQLPIPSAAGQILNINGKFYVAAASTGAPVCGSVSSLPSMPTAEARAQSILSGRQQQVLPPISGGGLVWREVPAVSGSSMRKA